MKKIIYATTIMTFITFVSCDREIALSPGLEEFDVWTDKVEYEVDEEVMFHLEGNPDMISFFSGELYADYEFRESRIIDLESTLLSFSTQHPVLTGSQTSDFSVLVATNFNDTYNYENVVAADWTDITPEFNYATTVTTVQSGSYDVSELYEEGKPLYVAFRYQNQPQNDHGPVRRMRVLSFQMLGQSIFGDHILGDPVSADFRLIEKNEDMKTASSLTTTYINFEGYSRGEDDPDPATDTWAVTKVFDLGQLDNGPDRPVAIKGNQDPELKNHIHVFQKPGEYTVTFIGTNANIDGSKQIVKQVKVTIVDPED